MRIRKKLLFLLFSCFCAITANAQDRKTATEEDPIIWSYVNQEGFNYSRCGLGFNDKGVLMQIAIRIKAWDNTIAGNKIFGIIAGMLPKSYMDGLWIWMSHSLPDAPEYADITYKEIDINGMKDDADYITMYNIKFDEPYLFVDEDLYIGYSYVLSGNNDEFPVPFSTEGKSSPGNTNLVAIGSSWNDFSGGEVEFALIEALLKDCDADDYVPGDVNLDEMVNVVDVSRTTDFIISGNDNKMFVKAADVNSDGSVNVTDVECITDIVLGRTAASAAYADNDDVLTLSENDGIKSLSISSDCGYRAFQMDIRMPEGSSIDGISLDERLAATHILTYGQTEGDVYRVLVRSKDGSCFDGGKLIDINGFGELDAENIIFVTGDVAEKHFVNIKNGGTTGINNAGADKKQGATYNLQGMRVDGGSAVKGVYIVDGKKVIK